jgi:hypothetical protein
VDGVGSPVGAGGTELQLDCSAVSSPIQAWLLQIPSKQHVSSPSRSKIGSQFERGDESGAGRVHDPPVWLPPRDRGGGGGAAGAGGGAVGVDGAGGGGTDGGDGHGGGEGGGDGGGGGGEAAARRCG